MSNYPLGAENDSSAPYNEVEYSKKVLVTLSVEVSFSDKKGLLEEEIESVIKEMIEEDLRKTSESYDIVDITLKN